MTPVSITNSKEEDAVSQQAAAPTMKDQLDAFVKLTKTKRDLDAELRAVKNEIAGVETDLIDRMADLGVSRIGHDQSGMTVYLRRQVRVKNMGDDRGAACAALKAAGLGSFVAESFNLNTLSAYFREQLDERTKQGEIVDDVSALVPADLTGVIDLTEAHDLRMTAS